jgi:penicillin-binding protein 1B
MNDIMKDIINRGTAAEAKAWGFRNAAGKTAFAGKTGTSRDGWFAGFTPEIVCVVYVGFDDNDDLGMKGSDSAMPIWADFMRETLRLHPEWNGDWQMPASIRKAEIDSRTGNVLRELNDAEEEVDPVKAQHKIFKDDNANAENPADEDAPETKEIFVTDVPAEFRRVELFVSGTVPNKTLLPTEETILPEEQSTAATPSPSETPFETWQEQAQPQPTTQATPRNALPPAAPRLESNIDFVHTITIMICPLTKMRATINCPNKQPKTFNEGEQPKEFCTFHVNTAK